MKDDSLHRLLRAAAQAREDTPNEIPFGFETRLLARWRGQRGGEFAELGHLLRRVIWLCLAVIALGGAGAWNELSQADAASENLSDQYAIADTAIGRAFEP